MMPDSRTEIGTAQRPGEAPSRGGCLTIVLTGMAGVLLTIGLFFLVRPLGAMVAWAPLVMGSVFLVVFFHYAVWGRWLGNVIRREVEEEEQRQPPA
jgi:hypothetical protein